jgi:osmoprotectant transport system substrate-binding protein
LTLTALLARDIDVGLLFSTNPAIEREGLVVLQDDRGLQPPENVVPVIRRTLLSRYGPSLASTIDAVSRLLTTDTLRTLNGELRPDGAGASSVATRWLVAQGLIHEPP